MVWPFTEAGRFLIPLIPCLLIGAVEGLWPWRASSAESNAGSRMRPSRRRLYAASLVLLASLPYSSYMLATGRTRALEATHRDFDAACAWIAAHPTGPARCCRAIRAKSSGRPVVKGSRSPRRNGPASRRRCRRDRPDHRCLPGRLPADRPERYAGALASPLARFVAEHPELGPQGLGSETGRDSVSDL